MRVRAVNIRNRRRRKQLAESLKMQSDALPFTSHIFIFSELSARQRKELETAAGASKALLQTGPDSRLILTFFDHEMLAQWSGQLKLYTTDWSETVQKIRRHLSPVEKPVWQWKGRKIDFNAGPFVMGILNVTPDSFSDGGSFNEMEKAVGQALRMEKEGAAVIDIGGESTRPGAEPVSEQEETDRILPVIEGIREHSDVLISVDTYKSSVAERALQSGADIINDISAATFDPEMAGVATRRECPLICMHIKGEPRNMQKNPFYEDVTDEIYGYFADRIRVLNAQGVQKLILDPGIGFGKRIGDNLELIRDLDDFRFHGYPLLVGSSRKAFIGKILGRELQDRLYGTLATVQVAVQNGADIVRVHEVRPAYELLLMQNAIDSGEPADHNG